MSTTYRFARIFSQTYSDLFGTKTIEGRPVNVEALIARHDAPRRATRSTSSSRPATSCRPASPRKEARYDFLDGALTVSDPDGNQRDRRGDSPGHARRVLQPPDAEAWRVASGRPIPADVQTPGLEGTGPSIDLGMAMGALNSGASSWMWDWEDAGGDYRDQLYQAWRNLKQILAHEWVGRPFVHPRKDAQIAQLHDQRAARQVADDLSPRAGPAPPEPADDGRRRGGAGRSSRRS